MIAFYLDLGSKSLGIVLPGRLLYVDIIALSYIPIYLIVCMIT